MNQPKPLGLSQIFMRFFTGLGAGFTGSIVLGIVLFLTWGIVGNTLSATPTMPDDLGLSIAPNSTHPLFLFFVILGVFLSILIANLANVLLIGIVDEKYQHRSTLLSHTFFGNLALLLLIIPVYFAVAKTWGPESAGFAALFHVIISSLFSFFVLEVLNEKKYLIVNVYGAIIGLILFALAGLLLSVNTAMLAFLALPMLLGFFAAGNGIAQSIYAWIYTTYGSDLLNSDTRFGEDYGKEE
ncbi:hypothetical protein HN954_02455 [bacterium]|jgi:hypothetical protein|nr:hypothetical protein [bacterium]MBT6996267.1 hypothetical protein [bacterium]MBT7772945.1 hypothetical protein [bacterium]